MSDLFNLPQYSITEISAAIIIANILLTFILSLIIGWVYQRTHKGISYSSSFLTSLVLMALLSSVAMMILSNNLVRALGVLGIFALIRFRTILKDTKDVAYLFFGLAMGMAVGTSNYAIAAISTPAVSLIMLMLDKYNFGSAQKSGFLLTLITDGVFDFNAGQALIGKHARSCQFLQAKTQPDGAQEYYFSVLFKEGADFGEFIRQMKALVGVKTVELISGKNAVEY